MAEKNDQNFIAFCNELREYVQEHHLFPQKHVNVLISALPFRNKTQPLHRRTKMACKRKDKNRWTMLRWVREYRTNGGGLKMKEWCQKEGCDYFKVRHYSKREPMFPGLVPDATDASTSSKPSKLINLEMTVDSDSPSAPAGGDDVLHVSEVLVRLSNSVEIRKSPLYRIADK